MPAFTSISLASRSSGATGPETGVSWYPDYDAALADSGAEIVYVSGINSEHAAWVTRALERGCHVVVDKPALPDVETTAAAVALARRRKVGLAEATVFTFHPQVATLRKLMEGAATSTIRATAVFSVPPLPASDFRYQGAFNGGSLSDLGPYAAAVNRLVFGASPSTVSCRVLTRTAEGLDTSFSVLMTHESGGSLAGHFGFVTSYQNRLSVLTDTRSVDVDRIFTSPPDAPATLRVRTASGEQAVTAPAADAFAEFLSAFAAAVERREFETFEAAICADAALLARLRQAAAA